MDVINRSFSVVRKVLVVLKKVSVHFFSDLDGHEIGQFSLVHGQLADTTRRYVDSVRTGQQKNCLFLREHSVQYSHGEF